jgi:hypothetical protein
MYILYKYTVTTEQPQLYIPWKHCLFQVCNCKYPVQNSHIKITNLLHWNEPLLAQSMRVTLLLSIQFLSHRSFLEVMSQLVHCHAPSLATATFLSKYKSANRTKHWWYSRILSYLRTYTEGPTQQPHSNIRAELFYPSPPPVPKYVT